MLSLIKFKKTKSILNAAIELVREKYDKSRFEDGDCANLALALYQYIRNDLGIKDVDINLLYRVEKEKSDDTEFCRTLSHVFVGIDLNSLDISGWMADERWVDRIFDDLEPSNSSLYNDTDYKTLKGVNVVEQVETECASYGVRFDPVFISDMVELMKSNTFNHDDNEIGGLADITKATQIGGLTNKALKTGFYTS